MKRCQKSKVNRQTLNVKSQMSKVKSQSSDIKGYVVLISVLIVGAVGLAVSVSVLLLSTGAVRTSLALDQSNRTKGYADACVEEALWQIKLDDTYTGTAGLTFDTDETCEYTIIDGGGENRMVQSTGTVKDVVHKSLVTITALDPEIVVSSWLEVADF